MLKQSCIEEVIEKSDIVEVIRSFVDLKKAGVNYGGLCPFHDEKSPSFYVNKAKQYYKCFGCGKSGNVVSFVMEKKNLPFPDAIKYLAETSSIQVEYEDAKKTIEQEDYDAKARKIYARVQPVYRKLLLENEQVLDYLQQRGITKEIADEWDLGLGGMEWQTVTERMREEGLYEPAVRLGLISVNEEKNKSYDALRARLTIPVHDNTGQMRGFAGRDVLPVLEENPTYKPAKYINPKDSYWYNKSRILYGLDKAQAQIRKHGYALLVEGYFDVISMHVGEYGNTVAGCGTALTPQQCALLKRYCAKVVLMYDGDNAGLKAIERNMIPLIEAGLQVLVFPLPPGEDPDTWARMSPLKPTISELADNSFDALKWVFDKAFKAAEDPHAKDEASTQLANGISRIPQAGVRAEYIRSMVSEYKLPKKVFDEKIKIALEKLEEERNKEMRQKYQAEGVPEEYNLPTGLDVKWGEVKDDVENYALFIAHNRVYTRRGDGPYYFKEVSNFSIRIIQHMEDEKFPKKLVQIENVHGRKRTFDSKSEDFNAIATFKKVITGYGNFNFTGMPADFDRLMTKLMDEMGDGRMITVLGWQDEGFFAFNNTIAYPDGNSVPLDEYGCFEHNKESYYVPSGNRIYLSNPNLFLSQKRVVQLKSPVTFPEYCRQVMRVHREHGMNALLFSIASLFGDIIHDRVSFFPMLFLYGEPSSGKDNLIECCQAFFGRNQSALTITGKANTDKAKLRKFAQFKNMIVHMTEYKNGFEDVDLMLMGLWDRRGYERANMDSGVGTESVPILCSVIFTGNEYPTYDPLITRIIAEEMNKTEFTDDEKAEYERLKDITHKGVSEFTCELLKLRTVFEKEFRNAYKDMAKMIKEDFSSLILADRMIQNAAVLGATLKLTEGLFDLGFDIKKWREYMQQSMTRQSNKRETGSVVSRFWDCILEATKDSKTLVYKRDFSVSGDEMVIQWSAAYAAYARTHFTIFRLPAHSKAVMEDKIKRSECYVGAKGSHRFGENKSSGYVFALSKTGIKQDLVTVLEYLHKEIGSGGEGEALDFEKKGINEPLFEKLPF